MGRDLTLILCDNSVIYSINKTNELKGVVIRENPCFTNKTLIIVNHN